jgi:hypothetical protein
MTLFRLGHWYKSGKVKFLTIQGDSMSDTIIVDRRAQRGRSSASRQRLLRRIDQQIKNAIPDLIEKNSIGDLTSGDQKIFVPIDNLAEHHFSHDQTLGRRYRFMTGNDKFIPGDRIPRPEGGSGNDKKPSDSPEKTEDQFGIILNREEFLQFFYQDLELPFMDERRTTQSLDHYQWVHAGHSHYGPPPRLNVIHSLRNSLGRRIALQNVFVRRIQEIEALIDEEDDESTLVELAEKLRYNERRKRLVPFLEEVDLRFNRFKKDPVPVSNAVMFALMDVSGSMSKEEKDIAKRFFMFQYLMLTLNYDRVDIVWIRHTTDAVRVTEEEFFGSKETGGTIVSSAIELADKIRMYGDEQSPGGYPTRAWNIYISQVSDGDNMYNDMDKCKHLLFELMRYVNYYAYIQVRAPGEENLWKHYKEIHTRYPERFQLRHINDKKEIWGVFSELYKKRNKKG